MKKCGLIGGMSWESSLTYYKIINEEINKKLGNLHSGKIILYSVDFEEIAKLQRENNWEKSGEILANVAKNLENAGADFVLICTNTMHKVADDVKRAINIPLIDIRDVVIEEVKNKNLKKVLLLGTKFTMEDKFYKKYLVKKGIDIIVPSLKERDFIHKVIFNELCLGVIKTTSKEEFLKIINSYNVDGVILGCTEIGMIINQNDLNIEVLDTTLLHSKKAVELMIN
ncbi:aspartate/glutamate racemase family protein [Caminibacter mediatlanticus TB-2]|uniref:Aspartate/glutamate racemase family protein n=1 Tax=Caminibacter mediatlanticus TB-2 TaxID=391592 RepID=A0ABX5VBN6_9BACT|nr:aspartate/glutamate racemase family protein [Caminibacter mediatlanticus]QCT94867.1 aspartate/glutamate racemase family protein [Caminibacter mediatlanticus TB-2]